MHSNIKYENEYFTIGNHPWWTENLLDEEQCLSMENHLENNFCLGIGECGLDKLKGASKEIQEEVFLQHINLANKNEVPLIVHCVRQYDQVITFKKKYGKTPWVIHGFRRNFHLAKSLIDNGIMVSVSPMNYMNASFIEMLEYLPMDSFFIETDSEYSLNIKERYGIITELKKIDTFELQNQMIKNFRTFFKWKQNNLTGLNEQNY